MRTYEPELLIDDLHFPECLRWHDGALWFSDMFAGTVYKTSGRPNEVPDPVLHLDDEAGGIGWLPNNDLLVVAMNRRRVFRMDVGGVRTHADLSQFFEHPTNDMYVTEEGRAYVTGFGFDADRGAPIETVQLAVVESDGTAYVAGSQMTFPNGIDRWRDERHYLVAETYADLISVVSTDPGGRPLTSVPFARLDGDGPDGISCDMDGGVWVACAFGQRAIHLDANARMDAVIPVPGYGVFDCLLGGPGRRRLYLGVSSPDEQYGRLHKTGRILFVDL